MTAVDDLYALPPEEFTAARNALAKQLKAAGDKDAAADVSARRRPSVAAWALNQVAREEPALLEAALEAGDALRAAADAAATGDASGLRQATAAERSAAQAVGRAAKRHLGARGEALVPSLLATLRAAALDEEVADQVRRGTLATEHEQAGFGFGLEAGDAPVTARRSAPKPKAAKAPAKARSAEGPGGRALTAVPDLPAPDPEEAARDKAARAEAKALERQRKKDLAAAERTAARLERESARLAKEADEAEAEARTARVAADAAAERAEAAQQAVAALEARAPGR